MSNTDVAGKTRFLLLHDYGMGGTWWWVRARSAREVLEAFAEVEVIDRPETIVWAETADLPEVDIDVDRHVIRDGATARMGNHDHVQGGSNGR